MWEPDTLNVPLTQGLPSDRWTWGLVLVTEGGWWKHEADRDSCTVSILCGAEIDLTFKLPTLFDLSAIKLYFCLTRSVTRSHWTEQPKPAAAGWGWLWNHWLVNKKWEERGQGQLQDRRMCTYWTGQCGPRWAGCRHPNPFQNGRPGRNSTKCLALSSLQHRSLQGWRSRESGGCNSGRKNVRRTHQKQRHSHKPTHGLSCFALTNWSYSATEEHKLLSLIDTCVHIWEYGQIWERCDSKTICPQLVQLNERTKKKLYIINGNIHISADSLQI